MSPFTYSCYISPLCFFQEDISKLRRKIEKAKKPAEKISNGDDILNEEINDYKVGLGGTEGNRFHSVTALSLECLFILNFLKKSAVTKSTKQLYTLQCGKTQSLTRIFRHFGKKHLFDVLDSFKVDELLLLN